MALHLLEPFAVFPSLSLAQIFSQFSVWRPLFFSSCCFRELVFCCALATEVQSGSLLRPPECLCHLVQRELSSHLLKCPSLSSTPLLASLLLCRSWIAWHPPEALLLEAQPRLQLQFSVSGCPTVDPLWYQRHML